MNADIENDSMDAVGDCREAGYDYATRSLLLLAMR